MKTPPGPALSNDLLAEVRFPDKSTGAAGTANADKRRFTYNALGQAKTLTDQNQTVHAYAYDVLGRSLGDAVMPGCVPRTP